MKQDEDLMKLLQNGYNTDQDKQQAGSMPGALIRKRYSVGQCSVDNWKLCYFKTLTSIATLPSSLEIISDNRLRIMFNFSIK